jgi:hypothetical protein
VKLTNDVELVDGLPVAYIKSLDSIVLSDIHLGYEGVMAKKGMLFPKVNLNNVIKVVGSALEATGAGRIIVDGDIKNEFSKVDLEEFNELYDFATFVNGTGAQLTLIKGNHDNFVDRYSGPLKFSVFRQEAALGKYFFFHGEELPKKIAKETKMMIMGHEHPAIGIGRMIGKREKLRCFLYGKYMNFKLLVLPAVGYFSSGTEINMSEREDLLSPVFSRVNINEMRAIVCDYGETMDFGRIGALRKVV